MLVIYGKVEPIENHSLPLYVSIIHIYEILRYIEYAYVNISSIYKYMYYVHT